MLTFNTPPDSDGENDYLFDITITVTDGSDTKTESVRGEVTDVNEPPTFNEGSTTTRSVGGHADVGAALEATDPDEGDSLTYTLGGQDAGDFDIVDTPARSRLAPAPGSTTRPSPATAWRLPLPIRAA